MWEVDKKACPCGSGRPYADCCERFINGEVAPTAEALMRSRFSAYVKGKVLLLPQKTPPPTSPSPRRIHGDVTRAIWCSDDHVPGRLMEQSALP